MYHRYGDMEKVITAAARLQITEDRTDYISGSDGCDIAAWKIVSTPSEA